MTQKRKHIIVVGSGVHTIQNYRPFLYRLSVDFKVTLVGEVHLHETRKFPYRIFSIPTFARNRYLREVFFLLLLFRVCIFERVDLFFCHSTYPAGFFSIILSKLFRVPVFVNLDGEEATVIKSIQFGALKSQRRRKINSWVLRNAEEVFVLTNFQLNEVKKNLFLERPVHVVPRGVELNRFIAKDHYVFSSPVHFLSVGYIHPVKNLELLLKSFKIISSKISATLTVVGKDYQQGEIQRLAIELGINRLVDFVDAVPYDEISTYYSNADILMQTSWFESQAMTVVEAMASGVLVAGTAVGLMSDLSGSCCGTIDSPGPQKLADLILQLLNDQPEQIRLRTRGRHWAEVHSMDWTYQQYYNQFQKIFRQ